MMEPKLKREKRYRRHKRVRAKIFGTSEKPRLCVFRSIKHIYAQLIDDQKGKTLISASDLELKNKKIKTKEIQKSLTKKVAIAYKVGRLIAKKALEKKIEKVVFDRGGYKYHGRVKALAEGAREGGLKF
ncbi:MAG: 50S ribosomal protein L18 [Patescibacteria group bacterium]|nr:50S ribosomal protein L18 [Patescibacteria group bacterium]